MTCVHRRSRTRHVHAYTSSASADRLCPGIVSLRYRYHACLAQQSKPFRGPSSSGRRPGLGGAPDVAVETRHHRHQHRRRGQDRFHNTTVQWAPPAKDRDGRSPHGGRRGGGAISPQCGVAFLASPPNAKKLVKDTKSRKKRHCVMWQRARARNTFAGNGIV